MVTIILAGTVKQNLHIQRQYVLLPGLKLEEDSYG